jgi:uncharacterized phiE125 gp8 family phage protein
MSLHLITAPTTEPITTAEAKTQCRVDDSDHDTEIAALIDAVIAKYDARDGIMGRCIISQTWELRLPSFCTPIKIPLPPFVSLTSVKYLETDGTTETTVASTVYEVVDRGFGPALLQPKYGQVWPSVTLPSREDVVRVKFVAGYASASVIPPGLKSAMLLEIEQLYDGHTQFEAAIHALRMPLVASWF